MNAPLPESIRKAIETVSLDDKYALDHGRALMSGVQALVRLPMLQKKRDAIAKLNTAGFISGYRGSPLGGYDQALWQAKKHLAAQDIVFTPGVNEELAATAVWGSQQLDLYPQANKFDGVFGIWYGKGPGVDRCSDVFKHANMAGTSKHGGVIALAGDDHIAKSSTAAHQSDHIFKACGLPVFFPSSVQDILDMGLHAFAMSRFAGVWSGMKTIQEIVESTASVSVDPDRVEIVLPEDFQMPEGGLHIRWPDAPLEQEARLMDHKWYAALAYVRANKLNHNVIAGPNDRFGIMARAARPTTTPARRCDRPRPRRRRACRQLGIRLHKVGVVWPLEAQHHVRDFAHRPAGNPGGRGEAPGHRIPAEGRALQLARPTSAPTWSASSTRARCTRPRVIPAASGRCRTRAAQLAAARPTPTCRPAMIAKAIAKRLKSRPRPMPVPTCRRASTHAWRSSRPRSARWRSQVVRRRYRRHPQALLLLGCPHNTSTRVPEGSRAVAGIGCHYMTVWMDRSYHHLHARWAARACRGSARPVHHRPAHLLEPRRRHLLPQRPPGHPPEHRGRRQHHLQDPLQRRGRDDRRPAGRRTARRPFGARR